MRQIKPETAIRRRVKALQEALKAADEENVERNIGGGRQKKVV